MELVIGGIILIILVFVAGFVVRKKYYREVDTLESWKIDIMNRPVLEEMSKVKQLNMTGQTEELFEEWRRSWDEIVTVKFPDVEEMLFDAEEYVDKFRFNKSKETFRQIKDTLTKIDKEIDTILQELSEVVGSEEKNRSEIDETRIEYREAKKELLAHRHQYGKAAPVLELRLEVVSAQLEKFDDLTENGNYIRS